MPSASLRAGLAVFARAGSPCYVLKFGLAAPPIITCNRETAIRDLAEGLIHPSREENRRRESAAFS